MRKSQKNKNSFLKFILTNKLVFLILSVILLSLTILFFSQKQNKFSNNSLSQPTPTGKILNFKKTETKQIDASNDQPFFLPPSVNSQIINILKEAYSVLDKNRDPEINGYLKVTESGTANWTDNYGYLISDDNSQSIEWNYRVDNEKYQNNVHQYKSKIIPIIENVFTDNGFKKQTLLSGDYLKQRNSYYGDYTYIYEKDDIHCSLNISDGLSPSSYINLSCSEKDQKSYQYQIKILKDLNIKGSSLSNSIISGKYAIFKFNHDYVLAIIDDNDKYHTLYEGVDPPPCNTLIKNKVPNSLISTCYPSDNSSPISNPVD